MDLTIDLKLKLELHAKWLRGEDGGERLDLAGKDLRDANLEDANLEGANLRDANLVRANLEDANLDNLDFSVWPLWCGSFGAKASKRLFAQLVKHAAMLNVSDCDEETRSAMSVLRKMPCASWFDNYRGDLAKTPETEQGDE